MFDGFSLSIDSLRPQLRSLIADQKKRNQQARSSKGQGGTCVRIDAEERSQQLLEQHETMEAERKALQEGRLARIPKLETERQARLSCQMERHRKKRKTDNPSTPSCGRSYKKGLRIWKSAESLYEKIFMGVVEERVRSRVGEEWMRFFALHESSPQKWPDPICSQNNAERALIEHRAILPWPTADGNGNDPCISSEDEGFQTPQG